MITSQPTLETANPSLGDWWSDAIGLVQRVNARLRQDVPRPAAPRLRHGRRVLTDHQCSVLAGLIDADDAS